ncbi:heme-binding protein [Mycobacterium sp. SMC-4]|uniref:heme-binding protein n=1 Tax=Mycobacterium sp. SMC-4 TaxID=2857059 RepID=UPI003D01EB85
MSHKIFAKGLVAAAAGCGAVLIGVAAPAAAQPAPPAAPGCSAGDMAKVMSGVANAKGDYLLANPPVNNFFSSLKDVPREQRKQAMQSYFDANPQVKADLEGIRQPAKDFKNRCGLPSHGHHE